MVFIFSNVIEEIQVIHSLHLPHQEAIVCVPGLVDSSLFELVVFEHFRPFRRSTNLRHKGALWNFLIVQAYK